ncbi:hypothetical protein N0V93_005448 [Gnomoniopsis smithogilvyi]|uniref:Zn(2)-C6 fungal-type domain-containing protein n=1 Tax=Gnomoniopsis smithogilvyi TaxID=1191159 RepID=A0A9W8YUE2_9PEZI|nr:hypothetical protein N0V93_005448 [Gnomoniopsis smithogilvyi]
MANSSPSLSPPTTSNEVTAAESVSRSPAGSAAQPSVKKACDNCRLRKTRCNLANPCTNCASRGFECTYATPHRKRGPAGRRLNEIREREQQRNKPNDPSGSFSAPSTVPAVSSGHGATGHGVAGHGVSVVANPGEIPPVQQRQPYQQEHQHQQPQQQFVFVRNGNDLTVGPGAGKALNTSASWDGLLDRYDANSSSLVPGSQRAQSRQSGPAPASPSIVGSENTSSSAFNEAMFSLSNISSQDTHTGDVDLPSGSFIISPTSRRSRGGSSSNDVWPSIVTDENLIRWLDIYFERLYPTLPVLKRSTVFARLMDREHRRNPDFGAMLLSLSAFALIQPVRLSEQKLSSHSRENMVCLLLNESVKMRSVVDFGQAPTLDMIFTSVFLFACLFQKEQHNAAWLRLRESVELGALFGLDKFESYAHCGPEQKQQRLRVFYLLSVTERAYGIQRHHSIGFLGQPSVETRGILESISSMADSMDTSGIVIHDDVESSCMLGLLQLIRLFDAIDEDFLRCWNGQCRNDRGGCRFLDEHTAIRIYSRIKSYSPVMSTGGITETIPPSVHTGIAQEIPPFSSLSQQQNDAAQCKPHVLATPTQGASVPAWLASASLTPSQEADILINQQWLQNRLWHLCLSHKLLIPQSEHTVLCIYHAISIAENTLQVCRQMSLSSIEVHGVGLIEKLYTIIESAIAALRHRETADDSWERGQMETTVGPLPSRNVDYGRSPFGEGERRDICSGVPGEDSISSLRGGHVHHHKPLLLGFLELFRTIRAGEHAFLERYTTLVGQDLSI